MPFRVEGDRAFGPGTLDMKAGITILLAALREPGTRRSLRIVVSADEEKGSLTAEPVLRRAAEGAAAALVVEPAMAEAQPTTSRKGIGRFRIRVTGQAAHSGRDPGRGASAIEELAHHVLALHGLNGEAENGLSVNVGVIRGGTAENVVAAEAEALVDVRVATPADVARAERALGELRAVTGGTTVEVGGNWTRPPLQRSDGSARLFRRAREHGRALGLELSETSSGGGSDGNLVGALGVPVLDGLRAAGSGAHAADEHVLLPSLPVRARLLAAMLRDPGI